MSSIFLNVSSIFLNVSSIFQNGSNIDTQNVDKNISRRSHSTIIDLLKVLG